MTKEICVICKQKYAGFGNNAEPITKGRCCDKCNLTIVLPERVKQFAEVSNNDYL